MTTDQLLGTEPDKVTRVREHGLSAEHASALSGTLSLLSEPTRLRILYALDQVGEMCVGDLSAALAVGERGEHLRGIQRHAAGEQCREQARRQIGRAHV